ncbi:MAG: ribosome-binding factor A [Lentisphaeria bacterium]|nr:ribosome-binding factor A [Lentisphaeria bacterium]
MAEKIDRLTRVNELLKREIATEIERLVMAQSSGMLISVTEVNTSVDLRNATVGISIFGGTKTASSSAAVFKELNARKNEIQRHLARVLGFKHTPVLMFKEDRRTEVGDKVLELLNGGE